MAMLEFSNTVTSIVEDYLKDNVFTSIPAKILSVDNLQSNQTVDVQPLINDVFEEGTAVEISPILDVPVVFPSGGGGSLTFPLKTGETVFLVFSMRSIDEWLDSGTQTGTLTPADRRSFSIADAVAIPNLYTKKNNLSPNPDNVELNFEGSYVKLKSNGDADINAAGDLNATASGDISLTASTIKIQGNVEISGGTLTHEGIDVGSTHTHDDTQPGNGKSGTPTP